MAVPLPPVEDRPEAGIGRAKQRRVPREPRPSPAASRHPLPVGEGIVLFALSEGCESCTEVSSGAVHDTPRDIRERARSMRHFATREEEKLWRWLRNRRFGNHKFRRQYPIGRYVIDFYCDALKLAIEIDGRQHEMQWAYDERRTLELQGYGITVLRFTNVQVRWEPRNVAGLIEYTITRCVSVRASPARS